MIVLPQTLEEAAAARGEFRVGGTDLQERFRSGVTRGPVVDLARIEGLDEIRWDERGAARIGAMVRIAALARDEHLRTAYPGLAAAADGLATPQIREMGTLGGNLAQRTRCSYFRHPYFTCHKKGGDSCPAREGDYLHGVLFDLGPCCAPHPSTLGMALLAYEAQVEVHGGPARAASDLFGDGSDPSRDAQLKPGEIIIQIALPPPLGGERAAYFRAISRATGEWPLVEALARLAVENGSVAFARIAVGGVANIPLRLPKVEAALVGQPAMSQTFEAAARAAVEGANPLPSARYKMQLLVGTLLETLERALHAQHPN